MKKVLLLGGTNLVGPHVIKELLESGHDITVCTRGNRKNIYENEVKSIFVDTYDIQGVKSKLNGHSFDVVIDNIAWDALAVNNVLSNIETGRYVQISSMAVYGKYDLNAVEADFLSKEFIGWSEEPRTSYYAGKRAAECAAFQNYSRMCPAVVRPGYVTDSINPEHCGNQRIFWYVERILKRLPISTKCLSYNCTFTLAHEEARLISLLAENDLEDIFNVASEGSVKLGQIISYIERKSGVKSVLESNAEMSGFCGRDFEGEGSYFKGQLMDVTKLSQIGFMVSKLDDWLWDLLDYYIETRRNLLNG